MNIIFSSCLAFALVKVFKLLALQTTRKLTVPATF